jgi:hypothetical protein
LMDGSKERGGRLENIVPNREGTHPGYCRDVRKYVKRDR